jgi:tetratricopeptide (TPR) repeat protein
MTELLKRPLTIALIVGAIAFIVHAPALRNGFVFDDHQEIETNRALLQPFSVRGLLLSEYWGESGADTRTGWYRPVPLVVQWVIHRAAGTAPFPYHLAVLLAHAVGAGLLGWILAARFALPRGALIAGTLFAVHTVHAEAVSTAYGLKEVLAGLFSLAALAVLSGGMEDDGFRRLARLVGAGALAALAVLSKESAAPVPVALIAVELLRGAPLGDLKEVLRRNGRAALFGGAFLLTVLAAAISMRVPAVGGVFAAVPIARILNPIVELHQPQRLAMGLRLAAVYARMLVWPVPFTPSYGMGSIPVPASILSPDVLAGAALIALLAFSVIRAHRLRPPAGIGAVWTAATYLLASNLIMPFTTMMSERFLYLPSMGLALMLAGPLDRAAERTRTAARSALVRAGWMIACAAVLIAFAGLTWSRSSAYGDDRSLTREAYRWYPRAVMVRLSHATDLGVAGRFEEASAELERMRREYPDLPGVAERLGALAAGKGDIDAAVALYREAVREPLSFTGTHLDLARMLVGRGLEDEAIANLSAGIRLARGYDHDLAQARRLRGVLLLERGRDLQGMGDLRLANTIEPESAAGWLDLGFALEGGPNARGAERAYRRAVEIAPGDREPSRRLARLYLKLKRGGEAATILGPMVAADPDDLRARSDLGAALVQDRRLDEARRVFEELLARDATNGVALATLGSIEEAAGRREEARRLYKRYLGGMPSDEALTRAVKERLARIEGTGR